MVMEQKTKKILYVITKSNFGGAQRYVYELATSLPRDRFEVVVAFGGGGFLKTRLEEAGIRTHTIASFARNINFLKELRSMGELYQLMRHERPDVVHLNSSKAGGSGALIARLCGVKNIIFTVHGWPFYEKRNLLWRLIVWKLSYITAILSHHVIVVSKHDRDGGRMPGTRHKVTLIHTALPSIQFESKEQARATLFPEEVIHAHQDDLWLVSTGEFTGNKNLALLIDMLAREKERGHTNLFLTLVGDGEFREELTRLVSIHGLMGHVYFTGYIPEARTLLKAFDVFLLPSKKEGFPYGLLEAGAAVLPVIASRVGGIPELIEHHKTGYLIDPYDPESLCEAIEDILHDTNAAHQCALRLKENVMRDHGLARMCARTFALYDANGSTAA
jgi:glycosyltransferase involved in cell wall biosynthesis